MVDRLDVDCFICGGNDEHPRGHCTSCEVVVDQLYVVLEMARQVVKRPTSKAALVRMAKAIEATNALLDPRDRPETAKDGQR